MEVRKEGRGGCLSLFAPLNPQTNKPAAEICAVDQAGGEELIRTTPFIDAGTGSAPRW